MMGARRAAWDPPLPDPGASLAKPSWASTPDPHFTHGFSLPGAVAAGPGGCLGTKGTALRWKTQLPPSVSGAVRSDFPPRGAAMSL